ncbi:transposase [Halopseudomonas pachastrellae]|nr:transposase [Halopseudomonas pachastrellae]
MRAAPRAEVSPSEPLRWPGRTSLPVGQQCEQAGRLSKAGNAYLRSAFFMPALSAVRHDPNAKAFYEALQQRGKKKIQAMRRHAQVPDRRLGLSEARRTFRLIQTVQH